MNDDIIHLFKDYETTKKIMDVAKAKCELSLDTYIQIVLDKCN